MKHRKTRRQFISTGLKAGLALPLVVSSFYGCSTKGESKKANSQDHNKLNILILGGTSFLGPHQIAYAISRGHKISTFTRGKTKPTIHLDLFDQVEQLIGDRADNLSALEGRKWDAVIDNSGRDSAWTKKSANLLKDNCDLYLYTSSTGVYYPYTTEKYTESDQVLLSKPSDFKEIESMEYDYGIMKAQSELAAINEFGKDRSIIVRPTYMIGPADKTNRFIHWPLRLSSGGEVLVPGKPEDRVQYADVRDVAHWMIYLIEEKKAGTYNAVGPKTHQNMYDFVNEASKAFDATHQFIKIDDYGFLEQNEIYYIVPWIMPSGNNRDSAKISNVHAVKNGLKFRPIQESVKDIYNWWHSDAVSQEQRDKISANAESILNREAEIIKKWKALQ